MSDEGMRYVLKRSEEFPRNGMTGFQMTGHQAAALLQEMTDGVPVLCQPTHAGDGDMTSFQMTAYFALARSDLTPRFRIGCINWPHDDAPHFIVYLDAPGEEYSPFTYTATYSQAWEWLDKYAVKILAARAKRMEMKGL